ncbi:MAG: FG-GAP repeat protein [Deltaproteobacteria bacterium]|nr:FG-GAP repeat protein [Deltaproteobacteria bacterium]
MNAIEPVSSHPRGALFGLLFLAGLGGCSADPACNPGASVACACTDGRTGAQVCGADGRLGACVCTGPADASVPRDVPIDVATADGSDAPALTDGGTDLGPVEAGPDGPLTPDGLTSEASADGPVDLPDVGAPLDGGPDAPTDVRAPDAPRDVLSDAAPDVAGDAPGDISSDASGDLAGDGRIDAATDAGTDAAGATDTTSPADGPARDATPDSPDASPDSGPDVRSCAAGQHLCGERCANDMDPSTCGSACTPCAVPFNGAAACDGVRCGIVCNSGFHACGSACARDDSPDSCGSACAPCPAPPTHGAATCERGACGFSCDRGYVRDGAACVVAPRLLAPLSTAIVLSRRPQLRWELPPGVADVTLDLCRDRGCTRPIGAPLRVAGGSARPGADLPVGVVFWRVHPGTSTMVSSATWQFTVEGRRGAGDGSYESVLDVNGDGFSDIVVGQPQSEISSVPPGEAYVFLGSASGVPATTTIVLRGSGDARGEFGCSVASAGDVNGDGFGDVLVGAQRAADGSGRAFLFAGGPGGVATTPTTTLDAPVGRAFGGTQPAVGDMNGDGYGDVLLVSPCAPFAGSCGDGRAFLFLGGPTGLATRPAVTLAPPAGRRFGGLASGAGDANDDGRADLLLSGVASADGAYLFLGTASGVATAPAQALPTAAGTLAFQAMAAVGDVNGDGRLDVALGAPGVSGSTGAVSVHLGSAGGFERFPSPALVGPDGTGTSFGNSLSRVGDLDGNGYDDLLVGAPNHNRNTGAIYVYLGGASGLGTAASLRVLGLDGPGAQFGVSVAGAGDVNGDTFADLVVGAYRAAGEGRAYVFLGTGVGLPASPSTTLMGLVGGQNYFGYSVAARWFLRAVFTHRG